MKSKRNIILSLFILFSTFSLLAGKIEKGFEALNSYNYFEAKEIFYSTIKKQASPSAFGLATIYYKTDNTFHSLDSAYKYINISESTYSLLNSKDKEKLKKYGFEYLSIIDLRSKISAATYEIVKKQNTLETFNLFIKNFEWSNEKFDAITKRDSIAFEIAKNTNSSAAYNEFLTLYPTSELHANAFKQFNLTQYREQTNSGLLSSYLSFVKQFPDNPYVKEADDRIYELSTQANTIEDFNAFIKAYPSNRNTGNV